MFFFKFIFSTLSRPYDVKNLKAEEEDDIPGLNLDTSTSSRPPIVGITEASRVPVSDGEEW